MINIILIFLINWKQVIYHKLYDEDDKKALKDKRKQNFRIITEKHILGKDNNLYLKLASNANKIELYKIPYKGEVISLFEKFHDNNGHLQYKRLYNEIKEAKYI